MISETHYNSLCSVQAQSKVDSYLVTSSILHSTILNADISICACVVIISKHRKEDYYILKFQFTWVALRVFHGDVESEPRVRSSSIRSLGPLCIHGDVEREPRVRSSIVRNLGLLCIQWHTWLKSHFRYTGLQLVNIWWATLIFRGRLTTACLN